MHTLRAELSWSQYGVLMRIDDPAFRLVDLKIGVFEDRDVGQMNKYVTYYRERVPQYPWEKPAIGLIVCARAGREEVHYALGGLEAKVFVAEYRVQLPSEQRIKERLEAFSDGVDDG